MTTKQIAEAVGKKERAVHNWVAKVSAKNAEVSAKIAEARRTSKPADYDEEEVLQIIEAGMGANAAGVYRWNAATKKPADESRIDRLEGMVFQLVAAMTALVPAMAVARPQPAETPTISARDELRQVVAKAARESGDYAGTWGELYSEIYYRLHINVRERAKNAKVTALEIIEAEGLTEPALAIAKDLFGISSRQRSLALVHGK